MRREEGQGDEGEQGYNHHHNRHHPSNFMTGRAISCSDLLLDLNDGSKVQNFHQFIVTWHWSLTQIFLLQSYKSSGLAPLDSIPSTPEPPKLTSSPIIVMRRNAALISGDTDGVRSRSRLSTYSTTSSTSGIGSIDQSQLDLTSGSLTPTEQHPLCSSTPIHSTRVPINSFLATIQQQMALASIHEDRPPSWRAKRHSAVQQQSGRKMSWAHFRLPLKMKKG